MKHAKLMLGVLAMSLAPSITHAQQPVVMKGTTTYYRDRDDLGNVLPEAERSYQPQPNVHVKAFRKSVVGNDTSRIDTTGDATYELKVAEGPPFHVLFHEDGFVPDLKTLTADPKKLQRVHVTMLTPRQFEEIFGRDELVTHLKKIMRLLKRTEGVGADEIKRLEEMFKRKFGVDTSGQ